MHRDDPTPEAFTEQALPSVGLSQLQAADGAPALASALPREVYGAALSRYGSIGRAREAAGLPAKVPARRRWTEPAVLEELRRLHGLGLRIRERELRNAGHSGVVQAAQLLCGGLTRAREAAQIEDGRRTPRDREPWDAERVVSEIRALHESGGQLASSKVDPRLYLAARRYFGRWGDAIDAAGLAYAEVRIHGPSQPAEVLLAQLRELAAASPAMTASQLEEHQLAQVLRRRFRSLPAAVRAAGLVDWPVRARRAVPEAEQVVGALRARHAAGDTLLRTAVRRELPTIVRAAVRHFGSWKGALVAAGLPRC